MSSVIFSYTVTVQNLTVEGSRHQHQWYMRPFDPSWLSLGQRRKKIYWSKVPRLKWTREFWNRNHLRDLLWSRKASRCNGSMKYMRNNRKKVRKTNYNKSHRHFIPTNINWTYPMNGNTNVTWLYIRESKRTRRRNKIASRPLNCWTSEIEGRSKKRIQTVRANINRSKILIAHTDRIKFLPQDLGLQGGIQKPAHIRLLGLSYKTMHPTPEPFI
jgi:hypothetical protein